MSDFYDQFFTQGWPYFYKFCLSMLEVFKDKLLKEDEFSGILQHIKFKTPEKNPYEYENAEIIVGTSNSSIKNSPNPPSKLDKS